MEYIISYEKVIIKKNLSLLIFQEGVNQIISDFMLKSL